MLIQAKKTANTRASKNYSIINTDHKTRHFSFRRPSAVSGHLTTSSANGRKRFSCNVFDHWLRPFSRDLNQFRDNRLSGGGIVSVRWFPLFFIVFQTLLIVHLNTFIFDWRNRGLVASVFFKFQHWKYSDFTVFSFKHNGQT